MGERHQDTNSSESLDDIFEPAIGDLNEEELSTLAPISSEKRRRAEQRLEEKRLRDELGDYDLELDDF